jgi:hypothetical protein
MRPTCSRICGSRNSRLLLHAIDPGIQHRIGRIATSLNHMTVNAQVCVGMSRTLAFGSRSMYRAGIAAASGGIRRLLPPSFIVASSLSPEIP